METAILKAFIIQLIGDCIDEESIPNHNSFVEMDCAVIHHVGDGDERYFKVSLDEVDESEYWKPYQP